MSKELKIISFCIKNLKNVIKKVNVHNKEIILFIDKINLYKTLEFLKYNSNLQFKSLIDICAVDYLNKKNRFEVVYNLLSIFYNLRIRLKIETDEINAVQSVTKLYNSANWLEREVWDLYGIIFSKHPNLSRILTDYGFEGHPLRKDFPLTGYIELRYDENKKQIVYESIELTQEYRFFDSINPWEVIKIK